MQRESEPQPRSRYPDLDKWLEQTLGRIPTAQLVEQAHDLVGGLCTKRREWRMTVPPEATDSDVLLTGVLERLVAEHDRLTLQLYETFHTLESILSGVPEDEARYLAARDSVDIERLIPWDAPGGFLLSEQTAELRKAAREAAAR